jgi:hypothetical protein
MKQKLIEILHKIGQELKRWILKFKKIPVGLVFIFLSVQIAVLALAFVVFGLLPVRQEVSGFSKGMNQGVFISKDTLKKSSIMLANSVISAEHHEAVLKSKLQFSKADSIALLIDLNDSLAILTFKGADLLRSKISKITFNKGIEKLPIYLLDSLFSGPFKVVDEYSTIEKFPIVVKKAPKDTLEANMANAAPELPKQTDVFWFCSFDNRLMVEIRQQEEELIGGEKEYKSYRKAKSQWLRKKSTEVFFNSHESGYTYQISIEIPREQARSIYRALPVKPIVLVRY